MKTIKTFNFSHESNLVKSILESEGYYCELKDEFTIHLDVLLSNTIGGIKLQVREADEDSALIFLKERGYMNEVMKPDIHQKMIFFIEKYSFQFLIGILILCILLFLFFGVKDNF